MNTNTEELTNLVSTCYVVKLVPWNVYLPQIYLRMPNVNKDHLIFSANTVFDAKAFLREQGLTNVKIVRQNNFSFMSSAR